MSVASTLKRKLNESSVPAMQTPGTGTAFIRTVYATLRVQCNKPGRFAVVSPGPASAHRYYTISECRPSNTRCADERKDGSVKTPKPFVNQGRSAPRSPQCSFFGLSGFRAVFFLQKENTVCILNEKEYHRFPGHRLSCAGLVHDLSRAEKSIRSSPRLFAAPPRKLVRFHGRAGDKIRRVP